MPTLTVPARALYRDLRKQERQNMQTYDLDLFEDEETGGLWLAAIGTLLLQGDKESAAWLWAHPVGNPFEVASDSLLQSYYRRFGKPMGSIEDDDWVLKMLFDKGGAGSGNWGHAGRPGAVGGSASARGTAPSGATASHIARTSAMSKLGIKHGPMMNSLIKAGLPSKKVGGKRMIKWPEAKEWYDAYTSAGKGKKGIAAANAAIGVKKEVKVAEPPAPPKPPQQLQYTPRADKVDSAIRSVTNSLEKEAKRLGMSAAELEKECYDKVVAVTANEPITIRRGARGATSVLQDGRFKTQFETGTSGGCFSPKHRTQAEDNGLGIPHDIDPTQRPVYGYIQVPGRYAQATSYGAIKFTLKDEVRDRTTVTIGDSLGAFVVSRLVGRPATNPTKESWDERIGDIQSGFRGLEYIEAQVQGGVTLKDVAKITFGVGALETGYSVMTNPTLKPDYKKVYDLAKKTGIPVEIDINE